MKIHWHRVIPRDLFNEAKLLKCLGQVALLVHDRTDHLPVRVELLNSEDGFPVELDPSDGSLSCPNLQVWVNDKRVRLFTRYNSQQAYPLYAQMGDEMVEVFNDLGAWSGDFMLATRTYGKDPA